MCMCVSYMEYMCTTCVYGALKVKRYWIPLEMELQVVVSHLLWDPVAKPRWLTLLTTKLFISPTNVFSISTGSCQLSSQNCLHQFSKILIIFPFHLIPGIIFNPFLISLMFHWLFKSILFNLNELHSFGHFSCY